MGSFAGVAAIPAEGWWTKPVPPLEAEMSPDPNANIVVTLATPRSYAVVLDALRQLDAAVPQLTVEVAVVEVTLTDDMRYGVQRLLRTGSGDVVLTEAGGTISGPPFNAEPPLARAFPGFGFLYEGADIAAVLSALEARTSVRVLSRPRLALRSGRTARLHVGDEVPVVTAVQTGGAVPPGGISSQIDYRDTAITLLLGATIGANGLNRAGFSGGWLV